MRRIYERRHESDWNGRVFGNRVLGKPSDRSAVHGKSTRIRYGGSFKNRSAVVRCAFFLSQGVPSLVVSFGYQRRYARNERKEVSFVGPVAFRVNNKVLGGDHTSGVRNYESYKPCVERQVPADSSNTVHVGRNDDGFSDYIFCLDAVERTRLREWKHPCWCFEVVDQETSAEKGSTRLPALQKGANRSTSVRGETSKRGRHMRIRVKRSYLHEKS